MKRLMVFAGLLAVVPLAGWGELVNPERGYCGVRLVGRLPDDGKWNAPATVAVGTRTMKTYPFSDPDPVPCIGEKRYPYCRYDGSSAVGAPKAWQTVVLENGLIRVTLTPEIGGKVWGATDLRTGVDFVYDNHVVKFRDVATRGPWTSGGIEYNFGIVGHAPSCSTPVDWFVRTNADASVSCFIASEEYITRSRWQVEVRLRPGAEEFETHTTWYNASGLPQPYYHWMNAAYSVRGNPRFLFPGSQYVGHAGDVHAWPLDEKGRDLSVFEGNAFGGPKSYHLLPGDNSFYGIWWPEKGVGAYHRNETCEKYGRKIWLWALSRAGGIWEDLLTDTDGQYTELQSGRCFQQPQDNSVNTPFDHPIFNPGSTECFSEHWGVLREEKIGEENRWSEESRTRPVVSPKDFDRDSAYGLYLRGRHCFSDRSNSYAEAESWFRKALAKDAYFRPALVALAALENRRGNYAACHRLCEKVLALDTYDTDANYLDGFAYFAEGDNTGARDRLGVAAFDGRNRSSAYSLVARTYLREGKPDKALAFADKALAANAANLDALLVKAIALRNSDEFRPFADDVLAHYPLFHAVRYLRDGLSFRALVRNELTDQTYLELGSWFAETGLTEEAAELFACAKDDALAQIRRAFLRNDVAALAVAARLPVGGVSPFRRESLPALRWAAEEAASWKFRYYFAVALAALDRKEEAKALFDTLDGADEAVAFLVRAAQRTGAARLADLRCAQALDDSWRVGRALCAWYDEAGDKAAFLKEATAYLAKFPKNNAIQSAYAKALHQNGRNRECLDFLKDVVFLPSELRGNVSEIWRAAQKELGLEITYPENLGTGRPYPSDENFRCVVTNAWVFEDKFSKHLCSVPPPDVENAAYGKHPRDVLHLWLPKNAKGKTPLIVYYHGGSWTGGYKLDRFMAPAVPMALSNGVAFATVDYRYNQEAKAEGFDPPLAGPLADAAEALKFLRANADRWNLDVSRFAVSGGSAGACTALWLGLSGEGGPVQYVGANFGQTSLDPAQLREWLPKLTYGPHAFGCKDFAEWLSRRDELLPEIRRFSPYELVPAAVKRGELKKVYLHSFNRETPDDLEKDDAHSPYLNAYFKERCDQAGLPSERLYGSTNETFRRLVKDLKGGNKDK